jgi:NADH dehydrogenase
VIGDAAALTQANGTPLPGVAPVAMQQGRYVAAVITRSLTDHRHEPFVYVDKGNLATIGRAAAVAHIGRVKLWGFAAWVLWLVVHILYLVGFRNRVIVLINWAWAYVALSRGARLITGDIEHEPEHHAVHAVASVPREPAPHDVPSYSSTGCT